MLNVAGYFDGLLASLDRAAEEQLLCPENRAMLLVESDPVRLVERFRSYTPARSACKRLSASKYHPAPLAR